MRRSLCAAMISLEAVVLLLTIPVLITVNGVSAGTSAAVGAGLALGCLLTAALLRKDWAYYLGHLIQVASIAVGFLLPMMFVLGGIFAALWIGALILGGRIDAAQRAAAAAD
jgi:hypothetical protein